MPQIQIDVSWSLEPANCVKCRGGTRLSSWRWREWKPSHHQLVSRLKDVERKSYPGKCQSADKHWDPIVAICYRSLSLKLSGKALVSLQGGSMGQTPCIRQSLASSGVSRIGCKRGLRAIRCGPLDKASKEFNGGSLDDAPRVQTAS